MFLCPLSLSSWMCMKHWYMHYGLLWLSDCRLHVASCTQFHHSSHSSGGPILAGVQQAGQGAEGPEWPGPPLPQDSDGKALRVPCISWAHNSRHHRWAAWRSWLLWDYPPALQASQHPDYKCPFPVTSIVTRPFLFILRHSCLVNNWTLFIDISALRFLPDNRCCDCCHLNACKTTSNLLLEEDLGNEVESCLASHLAYTFICSCDEAHRYCEMLPDQILPAWYETVSFHSVCCGVLQMPS